MNEGIKTYPFFSKLISLIIGFFNGFYLFVNKLYSITNLFNKFDYNKRSYNSKITIKSNKKNWNITSFFLNFNLSTNSIVGIFVLLLSIILLFSISNIGYSNDFSINLVEASPSENNGITFKDPNLAAEVVYKGLKEPTAMEFVGPDDILVIEKDEGTVQRIVNGKILPEPLISLGISSTDERGMLGLAIPKEDSTSIIEKLLNGNQDVFIFFTETQLGEFPLGNRIYKYELTNDNTKLANPELIIELPALPDVSHVGGVLKIGPDNNLYFVVGDQRSSSFGRTDSPESQTKAQNYPNGKEPDGRAGILRVTQDGELVGEKGILGDIYPLNRYYAYGIKNSFGFDFDPLTGEIWDTENGPSFGDEINLVKKGFNSGWANIQGIWTMGDDWGQGEAITPPINSEKYGLVDFNGNGKYSSPELTWEVAPTALKFLNSDKLGKKYENDMFVGDIKYGNLYHFDLDLERQALVLNGPLADKVADDNEFEQAVIANGFGGITDMDVGPDGYLYILSYGTGTIYKIVSTTP